MDTFEIGIYTFFVSRCFFIIQYLALISSIDYYIVITSEQCTVADINL